MGGGALVYAATWRALGAPAGCVENPTRTDVGPASRQCMWPKLRSNAMISCHCDATFAALHWPSGGERRRYGWRTNCPKRQPQSSSEGE